MRVASIPRHVAAAGAAVALCLAGCSSGPPPPVQRATPAVQPGPLLNLLPDGAGLDRVHLFAGSDDQVHLLIAATHPGQVLHVVVKPTGALPPRVVRSGGIPSAAIDGWLDANGMLHILLDDEYLVQEGEATRAATSAPWQTAGVRAERPAFVPGCDQLTWTFTTFGRDIGTTSGRWVWRGGGGGYPGGAALLFPWHEQTRKAVLVPDRPGAAWNVFDFASRLDSVIVHTAADRDGDIHVVYSTGYNVDLAGRTSLLGGILTRAPERVTHHYGRLKAADLAGDPSGPGASDQRVDSRGIRAVDGILALDRPTPIAVDAAGTVLLGDRFLLRNERRLPIHDESPFGGAGLLHAVATAGTDRFHAVGSGNIDGRFAGREGVRYAMLGDGTWSASLWLSDPDRPPRGGIRMVATRAGNAFVIWRSRDGLVGRWISLVQ